MAITLTRYDFRDSNNDLWHFRHTQDAQGTTYQLFNVDGGSVAVAMDMHMSFDAWTIQLIEGMMSYDS